MDVDVCLHKLDQQNNVLRSTQINAYTRHIHIYYIRAYIRTYMAQSDLNTHTHTTYMHGYIHAYMKHPHAACIAARGRGWFR
mgnify:CR=1 FL=1